MCSAASPARQPASGSGRRRWRRQGRAPGVPAPPAPPACSSSCPPHLLLPLRRQRPRLRAGAHARRPPHQRSRPAEPSRPQTSADLPMAAVAAAHPPARRRAACQLMAGRRGHPGLAGQEATVCSSLARGWRAPQPAQRNAAWGASGAPPASCAAAAPRPELPVPAAAGLAPARAPAPAPNPAVAAPARAPAPATAPLARWGGAASPARPRREWPWRRSASRTTWRPRAACRGLRTRMQLAHSVQRRQKGSGRCGAHRLGRATRQRRAARLGAGRGLERAPAGLRLAPPQPARPAAARSACERTAPLMPLPRATPARGAAASAVSAAPSCVDAAAESENDAPRAATRLARRTRQR